MAMKAMLPLLACMFVVASAAYGPMASPPTHSANCGPPPPPPPPCNGTTPSTPPPTTTPPPPPTTYTPPPTTTPSSPPTTTPSTPPPTTTPSSPPTTTPSSPPTTTPSTPPPTTTPSASPPYSSEAPTGEPVIIKACAQNAIKYCNDNNPNRKRFCQKIVSRCCAKYKCLPGVDKTNCPEWGYVMYHYQKVVCP